MLVIVDLIISDNIQVIYWESIDHNRPSPLLMRALFHKWIYVLLLGKYEKETDHCIIEQLTRELNVNP